MWQHCNVRGSRSWQDQHIFSSCSKPEILLLLLWNILKLNNCILNQLISYNVSLIKHYFNKTWSNFFFFFFYSSITSLNNNSSNSRISRASQWNAVDFLIKKMALLGWAMCAHRRQPKLCMHWRSDANKPTWFTPQNSSSNSATLSC